MCVTVVQYARSRLHVQINRVRLRATLFPGSFLFLCTVLFVVVVSFDLFGLFFFKLFFLLAFFSSFLLLTLPVMHLDQYIF